MTTVKLFLIITLLGICLTGPAKAKKADQPKPRETSSFQMAPGLLIS